MAAHRLSWMALLPAGLVQLALAAALAGPAPAAASAGVDAADAAELVETLVGLDPARHANPLAAMQGRAALYARYRERALAGDATAWRVWLLIAHMALVRADAGSSESFSSDLLPAYQARPAAMLQALAGNAWLVPGSCYFLGRHFDFEGRGGAGRPEFLAAHEARFRAELPPRLADRCLSQIGRPQRPLP